MQFCNERNKNQSKVKTERPKSATRCSKRLPTYVVAFAMQETYDNFNIPQQVHEQSPNTSLNSMDTPNSTDLSEMEKKNIVGISNNEIKIEINTDGIKDGDINDAPEIINYLHGFKNMEEVNNQQPEIIFNATKYNKRPDNSKFLRKKPKKYKRVVKFRNIHFKYKNPRKSLTTRLDKFYEKAQKKTDSCVKLQKYFYAKSITQVVSRSRILKKTLAKENLQDGEDSVSFPDNIQLGDNDDTSLASSPSTTKKSLVSYSSQNTLKRQDSNSSSRVIDFYSLDSTGSVIEVASENMIPYKTDVINVSVAVTYSSPKVNNNGTLPSLKTTETFILRDSLTSAEIPAFTSDGLTSKPSSNKIRSKTALESYSKDINFSDNDMSNETLTGSQQKSSLEMSIDEDTFFIAKTSSDFNKSSLNSTYTLVTNSESGLHDKNVCPSIFDNDLDINDISCKPTLLDTVINMGMFPEITPSTSSNIRRNVDSNAVIVTGDLNKHFNISQIKEADVKRQLSKTVLRKPFNVEQNQPQINLNLPNETTIKGISRDEKQQKISCSEEFRNSHPTNLSEMWDRLILVLDLAVKRLEETLSDKIIRELKTTLAHFDVSRKYHAGPASGEVTVNSLTVDIDDERKTREVLVQNSTHEANEADMCLQCNLIQNNVIDQIMLKLSMEGPKFPTGGCSTKSLQKLLKPKMIRDYFEILKAPTVDSQVEGDSKDAVVTVATTVEDVQGEELTRFSYLKLLFKGPMTFVRENVYIITSVPAFFILLMCFYGLIVVIMKP